MSTPPDTDTPESRLHYSAEYCYNNLWGWSSVNVQDVSVSSFEGDESAPILPLDPDTDLTSVHCVVCTQPAALQCRGCGQQKYCSARCQTTDWEKKGHQEKCSDIMSARKKINRLMDRFPEIIKEHNHITRASIEENLMQIPDEDCTLVHKDSIIVNLMNINAELLNIDMVHAQLVHERFYKVANHIVTKCLDAMDEDVLEPFEQARAVGVDIDNLIAERRRAQEEREDEERRGQAARDVDTERAELERARAEFASERTAVANARQELNQREINQREIVAIINEPPSQTGNPLRALNRFFSAAYATSTPSTPTTSVNYPAEWLGEPEKPEGMSGAGTCSICMERQVATIIEGCWHACMCVFCTRGLMQGEVARRKCPMCREPIQKVNRIFMNHDN